MTAATDVKEMTDAIHTCVHNIMSCTNPSMEEVNNLHDYWDLSDIYNILLHCWAGGKSPDVAGQQLPKACRIPVRKAMIAVTIRRIEFMMNSTDEVSYKIKDFNSQQLLGELDMQLKITFKDAGMKLPDGHDGVLSYMRDMARYS